MNAEFEASLTALGWDERRQQEFVDRGRPDIEPGRVARADRGLATIMTGHGELRATTAPELRRADQQPAVGDWVGVRQDDDGTTVIEAVLERRSAIARLDPAANSGRTERQVLATNVDVVLLAAALDRPPNLRRVERYLALGWQSGATPVMVLTKADLSADLPAAVAAVEAIAFGVPVHAISVVSGEGIDAIAAYARPNRTLALIGPSGVGKSTLTNRLCGSERLVVNDIRADGRGRHTTTHRELVPLPDGGVMLDTPGLRGVLLWDAESGLGATFADVEEAARGCRFADCRHEGEPGCTVAAAIASGQLAPERVASFRRLERELQYVARKQDQRARSDQRREWRNLSRSMRLRERLD